MRYENIRIFSGISWVCDVGSYWEMSLVEEREELCWHQVRTLTWPQTRGMEPCGNISELSIDSIPPHTVSPIRYRVKSDGSLMTRKLIYSVTCHSPYSFLWLLWQLISIMTDQMLPGEQEELWGKTKNNRNVFLLPGVGSTWTLIGQSARSHTKVGVTEKTRITARILFKWRWQSPTLLLGVTHLCPGGRVSLSGLQPINSL